MAISSEYDNKPLIWQLLVLNHKYLKKNTHFCQNAYNFYCHKLSQYLVAVEVIVAPKERFILSAAVNVSIL